MSIQSQIDRITGEVSTQSNLIAQIKSVVDSLPEAGTGSEPELQEKTVSPTTSSQTVTPDSGYDGLSKVTINAMPSATQATPSISVSSSGLITASATQTAGYVASGTKSSTKQLTTQAANTITPTKSSQTAVSKGVYTTGAVTVAAIPSQYITTTDANAVATDIRSSKTAYVNGTKITGSIQDFDGSYTCSGSSTGGGATGTEVETCTVIITQENSSKSFLENISAIISKENNIEMVWGIHTAGGQYIGDIDLSKNTITINDIVCNSVINLGSYIYSQLIGVSTNNATLLTEGALGRGIFSSYIKVNAAAGQTATISVFDDD